MKLAHSAGFDGKEEPLSKHLGEVAALSSENAEAFGAAQEAQLVGYFHDVGKLGEPFQQRLRGLAAGVDHWSQGAFAAFQRMGSPDGRAAMLCILGHHMGIPAGTKESLGSWHPDRLAVCHPNDLQLSPTTRGELQALMAEHLGPPPAGPSTPFVSNEEFRAEPAKAMLKTRVLFSALVDADFRMTEQHFLGPDPSPAKIALDPAIVLAALEDTLSEVRNGVCSDAVRAVREQVMRDARVAASNKHPLLTLTAPTGGGKTLALLAFALLRALQANHRRIIVVLPYLTLLQQTVEIYRGILAKAYPGVPVDQLLLEDHSLAPNPADDEGSNRASGAAAARRRRLAGHWDTPFIVTTNAQFLESLHANRPGSCRKLHSTVNSVVLMDEVQTLPRQLAMPTLATLSAAAMELSCTIVFSTATQPAFKTFDLRINERLITSGWRPAEIISNPNPLFDALRRVRVTWPRPHEGWDAGHLVGELQRHLATLCIVNLKRHAASIYSHADQAGLQPRFLTTALCPAHRAEVLRRVKDRKPEEPFLLIATQCVEAGVDLDFPAVFRAFAPLDALAQAAGRCNRNGAHTLGEFVVFQFESGGRSFPDQTYEQAAQVTRALLEAAGGELDLCDPAIFQRYYDRLYALDALHPDDPLITAIRSLDFPEVAKKYQLIEKRQINILVPFAQKLELFEQLRQEVLNSRLTACWVRRARPLTVGFFRPRDGHPMWSALETIPLAPGVEAPDWRILADPDLYHPTLGLVPAKGLSIQVH